MRQPHLEDHFQTAAETVSVTIGNRGQHIHRRTVSQRLRCRQPYHGLVLTRRQPASC